MTESQHQSEVDSAPEAHQTREIPRTDQIMANNIGIVGREYRARRSLPPTPPKQIPRVWLA